MTAEQHPTHDRLSLPAVDRNPDHPDVWAGLRAPTRGYPVTRPELPALASWVESRRGLVTGALNRGELDTVRRGLYLPRLPGGASVDGSPVDPELVAIAAVARRVSTEFAFCERSAARLIGLWVPLWDGAVYIAQGAKPSGNSAADRTLRRRHLQLPEADRRTTNGLVLTSVERTAVDIALSLPVARALPVVDSALLIGASKEVMFDLVTQARGRRGVRAALQTLTLATARIGSPAESVVRAHLTMSGLPAPETLISVTTDAGQIELDLGWRKRRVAIEVHGRGKYRAGADPVHEAERRQATFDAGWRVAEIRTGEAPGSYVPRAHRAYRLGGIS